MARATQQSIRDEASAWFIRLQGEDVSDEERRAFDRWMEEPLHAVAYARAEVTWERTERLKAIDAAPRRQPARTSPTGISRRAAAVGFLTIGAGAAGALWWLRNPTYQTEIGERRTIQLSDGSSTELNTASRLTVAYSHARRDVHLISGEAMFEVAKDSSRPFVVHANGVEVRAVGTAFNIRLRKTSAEVTVTKGVVAVRNGPKGARSEPLLVSAGKVAVAGPRSIAEKSLDEDALERRTAWRQGVIDLRGETLGEAVEEFNRYRTHKLVVSDPRLASMRVGGTFPVAESDKFLDALHAGFNVKVVEGDGNVVYLQPNA